MIVRCPSCRTTYKVADDLVRDANPVFRCSRCKHTFEIGSREPELSLDPQLSSKPTANPSEQDDELSFGFPPEDTRKTNLTEKSEPNEVPKPRPSVDFSPMPRQEPTEPRGVAPSPPKADPLSLSESRDRNKREALSGRSDELPHAAQSQPETPKPQDPAENVLALDPYRDQRASVVPYFVLLGVLLVSFGLLTASSQVNPKAAEDIVRAIPLLNAMVLKNTHLKTGVSLQSLSANFQTIQGNREVLLITGAALNTNPVVIREVRIAGRLYSEEGKEVEQQAIWIGNAISPKIVRGMTVQDISDLQRLKPLKTFEIPPGDSVPFTIVFLKAPKGVKDFACEVLSAEAEA